MTEQPPTSARALITPWIRPLGLDAIQIVALTAEIDALCEQRVSAETERCAQIAHRHRPATAGWALDATEAIEREIRAPAERPAPEGPNLFRASLLARMQEIQGQQDSLRGIGVEQPTQEIDRPVGGTEVPFLDEAVARLMAKDSCSAMALGDIAVERLRQIEVQGWTPEHDDAHAQGQLATAGAAYALEWYTPKGSVTPPPAFWPWHLDWWKPRSKHRNCVRAGALLVAELARHLRSAARPTNTTTVPSALASKGEQPGCGDLFVAGEFVAHSGDTLLYKIECDALTNGSIATLAADIGRRFDFSHVVGIPRRDNTKPGEDNGRRLAEALYRYCRQGMPPQVLLVDDVLTTGASMEEMRLQYPGAIGVVIFARGPCPDWVTPLYSSVQHHDGQSLRAATDERLHAAKLALGNVSDSPVPSDLASTGDPDYDEVEPSDDDVIAAGKAVKRYYDGCRQLGRDPEKVFVQLFHGVIAEALAMRSPAISSTGEQPAGWRPRSTAPDDDAEIVGYQPEIGDESHDERPSRYGITTGSYLNRGGWAACTLWMPLFPPTDAGGLSSPSPTAVPDYTDRADQLLHDLGIAAEHSEAYPDDLRLVTAALSAIAFEHETEIEGLHDAIGIERGDDNWPEFMARLKAHLADREAAILARLQEPDDALVKAVARAMVDAYCRHSVDDKPEVLLADLDAARAALAKIAEMLT